MIADKTGRCAGGGGRPAAARSRTASKEHRDIVVHRYLQVDPAVVRTIVEERLEDLLRFGRQVRDRMQSGV